MIKYIRGDLFKADIDVLVHGCNCFHTMGAGVAYWVKKFYPNAYSTDCCTGYGDKSKLGMFTYVICNHAFNRNKQIKIINAYTQYDFGSKKDLFEYDAFEKICISLNNLFKEETIGMPKIGGGLAGGDWTKIETIINKIFIDKTINIFYL